MARYQVILAYDGTHFFGFQRQTEERTVQGVLEKALREIGWPGSTTLAAGRTDTGVHASGQVIAFDLDWRHSSVELQSALNANLPQDVAARSVKLAEPGFHPRFDAVGRCYRYRLYCKPVRNPLWDRYAWRVWPVLDLERLQNSARHLHGQHDFSAFGTPLKPGGSTVRNVTDAAWSLDGEDLIFTITANAFLYHMVRRLVSFQVQIGQGKQAPSANLEKLDVASNEIVQGLAPPQGLVLTEVIYTS